MNRLITLQGYDKNKKRYYKYNPDAPPEYYADYELGFNFGALLPKLPSFSFPPISFPPIRLPPLPALPPLPPLPSFPPLPNLFPPPIPPVKITPPSVPALPPVKITPPVISVPPIKVTPPVVAIKPPVIDAKIPPPNQWKVDPKDVKVAGQALEVVGQGLKAAGTAISATGIGAKVGVVVTGVGEVASRSGSALVSVADKVEKAQAVVQAAKTGSVVQGLQAASSLASSVGVPSPVVDKITQASNVANQATQIQNVIQSGNIPAAVNVTQSLLNQTGIAPVINSKIDVISKPINQAQNLLNVGISTADKLLNQTKPGTDFLNSLGIKTPPLQTNLDAIKEKIKPFTVERKPGSLLDTLFPKTQEPIKKPTTESQKLPNFPFLKDPSKDPTSPLYLPPSTQSDKITPDKKPVKIPGTDKPTVKTDNNLGILLLIAAGTAIFASRKKKKK